METATKRAYLVVKGDKFQVARFCADRGIGFAFERETNGSTCGTAALTYDECARWFAEEPTSAPYPVGSLLYYQWHPIPAIGKRER